ncbi:MAG: hypothetical protein COV48_17240 [Elusimicrobia bacterium CG11_big_fil_rev_8_21_14_0_20_64_6]|nr:MAG: hypothetical protein COV48_17240 [Elusimicrobia bacterium CG11_big_fil_rev_8_21_14_0_20_64_6]
MKTIIPAVIILLSPFAASAGSGALPAFDFTGAPALRAEKAVIAAPEPRPADVIVKGHMLIQAGKDALFGFADTQAQFNEAAAHWTEVLNDAGIHAGAPTYKDRFFTIPYHTADGRVLRDFMADARQFPPKDDAGLRTNMALALEALTDAGLTSVSARVVNLEHLLPTYSILYLVKPETLPEHETRIRVLKPGGDIDADLIKASGVSIVQQPKPWLLVYIAPELGYVGLWAKTPEDLALRLEKRKAFLVEHGKRIVGEKLVPIDDEIYKFGAELLFFQ